MKFKVIVNYANSENSTSEWLENFDKEEIETSEQAENWAKETIIEFNNTLRPLERARVFVGVEMIGESDIPHKWEKMNLITLIDRNDRMYDSYQCLACGITSKRYGLGGGFIRDVRYRVEKYRFCRRNMKKLKIE